MRGVINSVLCGLLLFGCGSKSTSDEGADEEIASSESADADDGTVSDGGDTDGADSNDTGDGESGSATGGEASGGEATGGESGSGSGADAGTGGGSDGGSGADAGTGGGSDGGSGADAGTGGDSGSATGSGGASGSGSSGDGGSGSDSGSDGGSGDGSGSGSASGSAGSDGGSDGSSSGGSGAADGSGGSSAAGSDGGSGGGSSAGSDGGSGGGSSAGSDGGSDGGSGSGSSSGDDDDDEPVDPPPHGLAPVAICSVTPAIVEAGSETADWIGAASYDPFGYELEYDWTLTEVPEGSVAEMPDGGANRVGFLPDLPGDYVAELVVTNPSGRSSAPCEVRLTATPADYEQPIAVCSVAPNPVEALLETADWFGEESYDPFGLALTYEWTLTEVPAGSMATLPEGESDADPNRIGFMPDMAGTYVAQLVVTNSVGLVSEPCFAELEAVTDQPVAVCEVNPPTVATLVEDADWIGEDSYDPSGLEIVTYAWTLVEAPASSTVPLPPGIENRLGFAPEVSGTYVAELVVTNEAGVSSEPCIATLEAVSERPVAVCEVTPEAIHPIIESADWIGEDSYDPTGLDLTYSWTFTSTPAGSSAMLPLGTANRLGFVPDVSGTYVAQLVVTNSVGISSLPCTAVLEAIGDRPVAVCDVDPGAISPVVESADWIGNESTDPDDLELEYYWSLISTPEGSTAEFPEGDISDPDREGFVADLPGSYVAQLIVTNEAGISSLPCTTTLEVIPDRPVAICEVDPETVRPIVDSADWIGHDSFDPIGSTLTYIWTLKSKPAGSSASMPSGGADREDFFPDMAGTYVGQLVVINEFGDASDPCLATLVAIPTDNLWVEMFWESPDDDDAEDDMDLHFLEPGGEPYVSPTDCYWGSCRGGLDWGIAGVLSDNPFLDLDDFRSGPENIRIERPAEGTYTVVVHDFNSSAAEYHDVSIVTVNIYLYGALAWTDTREVWGEGEYVYFATINTATDVITPL